MPKDKKIAISSLLANPNNPRIQAKETSREAVMELMEDEGDDVLALARNIISKGWLTRQKIVVVKDAGSSKYIVADGNRRVIALQLLSGCIKEVPERFKKRIENIRDAAKGIPTKIECIICDDDEAEILVEEAHAIAGGRGQKQWTAMMRARHAYGREKAGKCDPETVPYRGAYLLVEKYLENIELDVDLGRSQEKRRKIARDFDVTTLDRLIAPWKRLTGLSEDELVEAFEPLIETDASARIIKSIIDGATVARTIWTLQDQENFLRSFGVDTVPSTKKRKLPFAPASPTQHGTRNREGVRPMEPEAGTVGHVKNLLRGLRPAGDYRAKTRSIVKEMKSFSIPQFRISFCLLTRCLAESVVRSYVQTHHGILVHEGNREVNFGIYLERVWAHVEAREDVSREQKDLARGAKNAFMERNRPMGWEWLCAISHRPERTPTVADVCTHFEGIFPLIKLLSES